MRRPAPECTLGPLYPSSTDGFVPAHRDRPRPCPRPAPGGAPVRVVLFCHSLISDWNHGNAHFLRGVCGELLAGGHTVQVFERANGWSLRNLREEYGESAVTEFHEAYPKLRSTFYEPEDLDLDAALDGVDIVIVHEWNDPRLVARIGRHRAGARYRLLFHDTHHRAVSA